MKFRTPRRQNPFANPLLAFVFHLACSVIFFGAILAALRNDTMAPIWFGLAVLAGLEGTWWYFHLRR
jgi:hypothetical protein